MRIFKNFRFRWFSGAFLLSALMPPLFFYSVYWLTTRKVQSSGAIIITQPFIGITVSESEVEIASGVGAIVLAMILCGTCIGILGLSSGELIRFLHKTLNAKRSRV